MFLLFCSVRLGLNLLLGIIFFFSSKKLVSSEKISHVFHNSKHHSRGEYLNTKECMKVHLSVRIVRFHTGTLESTRETSEEGSKKTHVGRQKKRIELINIGVPVGAQDTFNYVWMLSRWESYLAAS